MINKDYVTIYWSPAMYLPEEESWSHFYTSPENILIGLNKLRNKDLLSNKQKGIFNCPAYVDTMKNVYVVKTNSPFTVDLPMHIYDDEHHQYPISLGLDPLNVSIMRDSSFSGYLNINLHMGWLFFADEPIEVKFTAPYFPTETPSDGAMFSPGKYNLGLWYRDFNLDYHIPFGTKSLEFKEQQPLFYLEIETTKKIIFKRYLLNKELRNIANECVNSPRRYGTNYPLTKKYNFFKRSMLPEQVLKLIKDNLVE